MSNKRLDKKHLEIALAVAIATLLAGCGSKTASADLFPLDGGHRWTYLVTTDSESSPNPPHDFSIATLGKDALKDLKGVDDGPAWHRRSDDGVHYWLRSDATGTYRIASRFDLDAAPIPDKNRRYVLMEPITPGTTWRADTTSYLMERRNEFPREIRHSHPSVPMTYTIEAINQKVSTAAGNFDKCVKVAGIAQIRLFVDPVAGWKDLPLLSTEWYCPGVGLVKLTREERSNSSFLTGGGLSMELQEWQ